MSRTWMVGMLTGAAVLGAVALGVVQSGAAKDVADLSGSWRLDAAKSEMPGRPGGRGGFRGTRGPEGGGGWGGRRGGGGTPDGSASVDRGREGRRGRRLPDVLQVTQQGGVVEFADSTGALVQEIRVDGATGSAPPPDHAGEVAQLTGRWDDGTLVAQRENPRGGTMVQKYKLEDHGRTLEVRMEFKGSPDGGSGSAPRRFAGREVKLVYRRNG